MTRTFLARTAISSALLCAAATCFADKPPLPALRSPWDAYPVTLTAATYNCSAVAPMPRDIVASDYYSDSKHSVIDPTRYAAYQTANKQFGDVEEAVERAADNFRATGSRQAAACATQILFAQAQAKSMTGNMSSNQAYYVQNWALGALAVAWLKIRPAGNAAPDLTPAQSAAINAWMKTVAAQVEDYFEHLHEKGAESGRNNHFYWAGFSVMAAGIAANDRNLYSWGRGTYTYGVNQIQADGTLPLEMGRGQRALHYHLFAIAPLVLMAELGEANGDDLYAYDNSRLKLLVTISVNGLADNHFFVEKSGVAQDTPDNGVIKGSDITWLAPYARRFPNADISALLARVPIAPDRYLGGLPPP